MGPVRSAKMQKSSFLGEEKKKIIQYKDLLLLFLIVIAYFIIFKYIPMYGVTLAFRKFQLKKGILNSPWVGLKWFNQVFSTPSFWEVIRNTVTISFLRIAFGFPAPIILALLLNEVNDGRFKKAVQTITYLPHFLSWVVMGTMFKRFLSPSTGPINIIISALGGSPIFFLGQASTYVPTIVVLDIWAGIGWGSIIYLAAIAGVSPELYESAVLDGATRVQKMWYITIPSIMPTIIVLFIMRMGSILDGGFDQIFNTYNDGVLSRADIIDTYVYRRGLESMQYEFSSAVSLFKTVIGFVFVFGTNMLARRMGESSLW